MYDNLLLFMFVVSDANTKVERSCVFKELNQTPCDAARAAVRDNAQVTFCDTCTGDSCNGATGRYLFAPLIIVAPIYMAIKLLA